MPMATELRQSTPAVRRARRVAAGWPIVGLLAAFVALPLPLAWAAADSDFARRANEIEAYLPGHPNRALADVATTISQPRIRLALPGAMRTLERSSA